MDGKAFSSLVRRLVLAISQNTHEGLESEDGQDAASSVAIALSDAEQYFGVSKSSENEA